MRLNEKENKRVSEKRWMCERERERERERCRGTQYNYACFLVVFYNRWLDLSLGLRMRSTAVKESGSCMLSHLILKPCECQYSTMSSSLEHRLKITSCGLECRNGLLSLKSVFPQKNRE